MRKVEHQIIYITTKIPTMRMNETTVYQPFDIKIGFVLQSNFRSNVIYKMLLSSYNMDQIIVHLCWHDFVLFHAACFSKRQVNQNNNIQSFPSYTKQEKRTFSIRKYNFIQNLKIWESINYNPIAIYLHLPCTITAIQNVEERILNMINIRF